MAGGVAVVDQHQRIVAVGERADVGELRHIAVHREHAVSRDQLEARPVGCGLLQPVLELVHVGIGEAVAARLREAHAVDDRGVVEAVGNDGVVLVHKRLEQAAVGVETGGEDDGVVLAEMPGDRRFKLAVQGLCAADEADRSHAEAEFVHRPFRGGDDLGVIGEAKIIVGAEVERLARAVLRGDPDAPALRAGEQALALGQACRLDVVERRANVPEERVWHGSPPVGPMDGPNQRPPRVQTPQSMSASPRWIASASRVSRPSA